MTVTRSRRRGRAPAVRAVAGLLAALALTLAPARAPVAAAASPGLELTTAATYSVAPAARVVHVAIAVTARNTKPNRVAGGIITRYFYDGLRIAIHPEARNVAAREGTTRLTTKAEDASGFEILDVRFPSSLFYGQTAAVRITYDLPSGAPRSASDIRVGTAFVTFVAWAFGDRGSVRVEIPSSFDAQTTGSSATRTTAGTLTVFRAANVTDVGTWYLVVNADRKSALTDERVDLTGGEHLVIRAWPEDSAWSDRVRELLTRGLPELVEQTGLDWPVSGDINVFEVHTPLLEGYAGQFYPGEDRIEISEDLDDLTILHEASHAWFNSDLFTGRWIDEGLADTYAAEALHQINEGEFHPDPVSPTDRGAVKLNEWVHPGRITDDATEAREQYGYEASWTVIRTLFVEVGGVQMRHVLHAAEAHEIAYQGVGTPETVSGPNDWRRLLDLVDEIGRSRGADELFRRFVLSAADAAALDARAAARTRYAALLAAGAEWRPPLYVRQPMSDWQFDVATTRIDEASSILDRRDRIAAAAATLGLTPPATLRDAYQAATDSLAAADALATRELTALGALADASAAVAAPRAPFVALGLLGETPERDLAAAREAFTTGAPDAAARAAAVTALIDGAVGVGRSRAAAAGIALGAVAILLVVLVLVLRRRRRARRGAGLAAAWTEGAHHAARDGTPGETAESAPPYATLADPASPRQPDPPPGVDHGDAS